MVDGSGGKGKKGGPVGRGRVVYDIEGHNFWRMFPQLKQRIKTENVKRAEFLYEIFMRSLLFFLFVYFFLLLLFCVRLNTIVFI